MPKTAQGDARLSSAARSVNGFILVTENPESLRAKDAFSEPVAMRFFRIRRRQLFRED